MLTGANILVTGGTGSFGQKFVQMHLENIIQKNNYSFRDEMVSLAKKYEDDDRVRFFLGDVRDRDRLYRAMDGVDYGACCSNQDSTNG